MKKFINTKFFFIAITLIYIVIASCNECKTDQKESKLIQSAESLIGLQFTDQERDSLKPDLDDFLEAYKNISDYPLENEIPPCLWFNPAPAGFEYEKDQETINWNLSEDVQMPDNPEELAFYSVADLSILIRNRDITSLELTNIYLDRLKKYGDTLECVITITEDLALSQARRADEEIANGNYRGPLHGIPYGAKDLLAVKEYKTTWGAMPYKDQVIEETATVVKKLEEAGAVLIAKLTLGALAWGDVWFDGITKNPWNLEQGSSGSSAGSASATSAGLVAFSIGTETWGSIVSPSTRCGVTGLRPTYGRVSRAGAMALSWSMDKIGPICRHAEDCALVFETIRGSDGIDQSVIDLPFNYNAGLDIKNLRIGYLKSLFEEEYGNKKNDSISLVNIKEIGIDLIPTNLPSDIPVSSLSFVLSAEAAAAFDELTRSNKDSLLVRQIRNAWPNVFRSARFIPAVEYIQANRVRYILLEEVNELFVDFDVIISPSFGGDQLLMTNLTGHPCVVVPNGFNEEGSPTSITFLGKLYDEATILAFSRAYQNITDFDEQHPPMFQP